MELQYIVLTIIKILISVPAVVLVTGMQEVDAAALIGGHLDNTNSTIAKANNMSSSYDFKIDLSDSYSQEIANNDTTEGSNSEEIPDPSALVVPGYNLPENIFNRGKPFYLEKDPLTGNVDFNSKASSLKLYDDEYEYEEEDDPSLYDKANIDRRDGPISGSHKPSDINQLTPNFHDFLNLPVKYNPDKYVYPLISSSYANTKVQGNVNKHQNHKNYVVTTYKPTLNPTYYNIKNKFNDNRFSVQETDSNKKVNYVHEKTEMMSKYDTINTDYTTNRNYESTTKTSTAPPTTTVTTTTEKPFEGNLMNSPMNHPSFNEEFYSGTKKPMSLFEQLFGDYDETPTTIGTTTFRPPPNLFNNLPSNRKTTTIEKLPTTSTMSYEYEENKTDEYDYDYGERATTATEASVTPKVTSLPLGENHVTHNNRQPIIVATQNLREQLNHEKVKFGGLHPQAPSTSNIHIAPDQDTVSFVVGNHQNVDGSGYVGTSLKESPYDNNPFRPVYSSVVPEIKNEILHSVSSVTIQPIRQSEASLAIGVPINGVQIKLGQVVDEKLDPELDYPKGTGNKIIFPDDKSTTYTPDLSPPPPPSTTNREVLKLNSKPMFHQLPSDLTPPNEREQIISVPTRLDRVRPPWDPRPGHFHAGRPEYARPPRPSSEMFKRIDNLPNILPQFRPNMKPHHPHHYVPKNYQRQPLLERPSNRPIGFFEKLHPPPPPPPTINKLRNNNNNIKQEIKAEDRIGYDNRSKHQDQHFQFIPPKPMIATRRKGNDPETLQMIQAKLEKKELTKTTLKTNLSGKDTVEKPLYVVYPVNAAPLKLDSIDTLKKESVVIGTRAELPLPPSKIEFSSTRKPQEFNYELTERHDSPILKPHPRPAAYPIKSDFPYPLERPDPSILNPEVPNVEGNKLPDEPILSSNQWNTIEDNIEARIVNSQQSQNPNQISATLKTYTEKPIAVAYTPTDSPFSMPNFGSLVIPEIRNSEFTVSAIMHTHPQHKHSEVKSPADSEESTNPPSSQEFQAPFQASAHIDHSISQGWSVVRDTKEDRKDETTTPFVISTSEFDIENFKPQLEGGFKPIYSYPDDDKKDVTVNERQE